MTTANAAEVTAKFPITITAPELQPGERFIGAIISADGAKCHALILLPGQVKKPWKAALAWAASIGGELPDRCESALLFAVMKDEFEPEWYWTREQHAGDSDYAWFQGFGGGGQGYNYKSNSYRARAVRRLPIPQFINSEA